MLSFNRLSFTFRIAACLSLVLASGIGTSVYGQSEWPTALVTINTTGTGGGNGDSSFWSMSANGRYVLFTTDATDVSDSKVTDVFVRDLETGTNIPADINENGKGGFGAVGGRLSSTGRYLAFTSFATDLVPTPDNNHRTDVFVRDMETGLVTLVSVNRNGSATGNDASFGPRVSDDGRFVVFTSYAIDLVENYTPGYRGLFVRDLLMRTTTLVVAGSESCHIIIDKSSQNAHPQDDKCEVLDYQPFLSTNGKFLTFVTYTNLAANDNNGIYDADIYLRDLTTGVTTLVSVNATGTSSHPPAGSTAVTSGVAGISGDGRYVLFVSNATDIVPQPSSNFYSGSGNYYVRDVVRGETKLVTVSGDGKSDARNFGGSGVTVQDGVMSADGRFVVFVTRAINLTPTKLNEQFQDIFVRDMVVGVTKLVSVNGWGTASGNRQSWLPQISGDGRFITFYSRASDLVYNDNNDVPGGFGTEDVFVRDTQLGMTMLASTNRSGSASANNWSLNPVISTNGRRVIFRSIASDLVPYDTHGFRNIYAYTVPTQIGQVQFSAPSYQTNEGDGFATITLVRTGGSEGTVSVDYATSDGTASSRSNYTPAVGTLHFIPGEVSKTLKVLITDDQIVNGDRTVKLILSNPSGGATLAAQITATLTIKDNDTTTSARNPIDDTRFFVRQHYLDFLNREPDEAGFQFWVNQVDQCGSDAQCRELKRLNVSAAFFLSMEFQQSACLVYRFYKAAYGRAPTYTEFLADAHLISEGVIVGAQGWEAQLERNKAMFTNDFVDRASFQSLHQGSSVAGYYNTLIANTGVTPSEDLLNDFRNGKETRGTFFRKIAEDPTFSAKQFNSAFVLMQYFGYLRRNPTDAPDSDFSGYNFWFGKLNQFGGNYQTAEMVKAFIVSSEYRQRFGP